MNTARIVAETDSIPLSFCASGDQKLSEKSTHFVAALRPFSLVVAAATCALGITLAICDAGSAEGQDGFIALAILCSGLMLQIGVNLINDYADLDRVEFDTRTRTAIIRNTKLGIAAVCLACLMGLWIVSLRGWPLFAIGAAGVFGLWAYAGDPVNLKSRGLGLPAVFFLTGVMMVAGSYYAMSGSLTTDALIWSLPLGLFAMLLLLGNELRDYEADALVGHQTFTVRFGLSVGNRLYLGISVLLACVTVGLAFVYSAPLAAIAVVALALLPLGVVLKLRDDRRFLARDTGRAYALYALVLIPALWISSL